jgi:hypothetical protein
MSEDSDPEHPKPLSVDRLSILWRRINDHKMVQWGVAYVALATRYQTTGIALGSGSRSVVKRAEIATPRTR